MRRDNDGVVTSFLCQVEDPSWGAEEQVIQRNVVSKDENKVSEIPRRDGSSAGESEGHADICRLRELPEKEH